MPLNAKRRRELAARGNRLKVRLSIGDDAPSESLLQHLRATLAKNPLLKIRVNSDDRARCDALAGEIARLTPCELVGRTGFTILLAAPATDAQREPGAADAPPEPHE